MVPVDMAARGGGDDLTCGGLNWRRAEELGRQSVSGLAGRCREFEQFLFGFPAVGGRVVCWLIFMPGFFRAPPALVGASR